MSYHMSKVFTSPQWMTIFSPLYRGGGLRQSRHGAGQPSGSPECLQRKPAFLARHLREVFLESRQRCGKTLARPRVSSGTAWGSRRSGGLLYSRCSRRSTHRRPVFVSSNSGLLTVVDSVLSNADAQARVRFDNRRAPGDSGCARHRGHIVRTATHRRAL